MKDFDQKHPIICAVFIIIWGSITFSCGVAVCIISKELSFIILILFLLSGFLIIDGIVKIKKETRNKHIHHDHDLINYAQKQLDEAKRLSEIVNTTIDEDEFLTTFNEICKILEDLTQYEDKIPFESPPSKNLKTICDNVDKTIAFFQNRIRENEILVSFNQSEQKQKPPISLPIINIEKETLESIFKHENQNKTESKLNSQKSKTKYMSRYEIDRFARECNAYTIKEERKKEQIENQNKKQNNSDLPLDLLVTQEENLEEQNYDNMDGHQFEHYCAELLENNGFQDVKVTSGSGDQGIDIIAFKDGIKYGIQCKRHSSDIGNKAVQEAFSGAKFYDCHVPVVITNRYFTKSANELATKNGVLLWDRDKLNELIGRNPS